MTKLQAVNTILRALGENPIASLEIQYPTLDLILPALDEAVVEVLTEGWWFNTRYNITLVPDINGDVLVPDNTIQFYPNDERISFEGTRFISKDDGTPTVDEDVKGRLVTLLTFETCPSTAQYAITYRAAYNMYISDNGRDTTADTLAGTLSGYLQQLSAEHTRAQQFSAKKRRNVQRWYANLRT